MTGTALIAEGVIATAVASTNRKHVPTVHNSVVRTGVRLPLSIIMPLSCLFIDGADPIPVFEWEGSQTWLWVAHRLECLK